MSVNSRDTPQPLLRKERPGAKYRHFELTQWVPDV